MPAHAAAGVVESIDGVQDAQAVDGVRTCMVTVEPGEQVNELRSSWDRVAVVTAQPALRPDNEA